MYIGIDLGTSSLKILLVTKAGKILNSVTKEYPISYPQSGWSEQNPEDWFNAMVVGMDVVLPDSALIEKYEKRYDYFRKLYPALKDVF